MVTSGVPAAVSRVSSLRCPRSLTYGGSQRVNSALWESRGTLLAAASHSELPASSLGSGCSAQSPNSSRSPLGAVPLGSSPRRAVPCAMPGSLQLSRAVAACTPELRAEVPVWAPIHQLLSPTQCLPLPEVTVPSRAGIARGFCWLFYVFIA